MNPDVNLDDELLGEFINESREHLTTIVHAPRRCRGPRGPALGK
jgi:hypothetical protein